MGTGYLEAGARVRIDDDEYTVRKRVGEVWQFEHLRGDFASYPHDQMLAMLTNGRLKLVSDGVVRKIVNSSHIFPELSPKDEHTAKGRRACACEVTVTQPRALLGLSDSGGIQ